MSFGNSKEIISNQTGLNDQLEAVVEKHLKHAFKKPYQEHTLAAFNEVNEQVQRYLSEVGGRLILDSCCGVGQSTRLLAEQNPDALVIGVDKSASRIDREFQGEVNHDNFILVRADLNDFFRLVVEHDWPVQKHYILYPNPWPKAKHLQRRWHGAPVFSSILAIGKELELRSNWRIYLEEFQVALKLAGKSSALNVVAENEQPLTPFEAKYQASGQQCWQLTARLS